MLLVIHSCWPPKLLLPNIREFFRIPPAAEHESFDRDHVVLMGWSISRRSGVTRGIDHPQLRDEVGRRASFIEQFQKIFVCKELWVCLRRVGVEVNDVPSREIASEQEVEDICSG